MNAKIMQAVADHSYVMGDRIVTPLSDLPDGDVDAAMQTAARVLAALAVPGVADRLAYYAEEARKAGVADGDENATTIGTALRTLADAAKGTP